ncbi:PREDICTED: interferon-induced very large GTPase 1-like [Myotis davidii]|uniref:interferon-induced very large GTPase 1-like n=1 Tax=Myotis davidii TaxID=225400 RepID=UPI000766E8A3|nr:PREDICTED: interferon-induced very large GTPase 1-like [Myotis davidii]
MEAQRKASCEVSLSLGCFLNYLQETEPDTHLLLLCIAAGAGYHVVNNKFQSPLGFHELDFLLDTMQTAQDKYQELKNICTYRAQAFLVLTGLTATSGLTDVSPEEKIQRLVLISHHLDQYLSKEVAHVLSKSGADHDWKNLEEDLRLLIDGNYEDTISSLQIDEIGKNLQSNFPKKKQSYEPHDNRNTKWEVIEDTAFLRLLQSLGLKHYYPKGMSRANFHLINKTSVYNSHPRSERELPLYFLQTNFHDQQDFCTLLKISVGDIKNSILSAIDESTARAKDKSSTVSGWLDLFCDHLGSKLNFPRKDLVSIEHQEIKDIEFLKEAMSEALDPAMITVEQECLSKPEEDMVLEIQKMLFEHLCGCWKQCPFCGAICTNTIPNHDGDHSVPFHRPQAIKGGGWVNTDHFVIDYCTSLVTSDCYFILDCDLKTPYKTYRQAGGEYATWSITPDTYKQPYWKWFVCHFRSNLEEKYQKKFIGRGEIPDAWTKITKEDVLDDLENQ